MSTSEERFTGPNVGPVAVVGNVVGLGLVAWGVVGESIPGTGGSGPASLALLGAAAILWTGWIVARAAGMRALELPCLFGLALTGGALAAFAPAALAFVGVAALGAAIARRLAVAAGVAVSGLIAFLIASGETNSSSAAFAGAVAAATSGLILGVSRRESVQRATQAAHLELSEARAETERARAELLDGRNHMARELHDVLAHTLSALSVQLEALDSLVDEDRGVGPEVRSQIAGIKRLVREGLDEARGAVKALREDLPPIEDQLSRLTAEQGFVLEVVGTPRELPAEANFALYRVAQESLTNAIKHAPGSPATVRLVFAPEQVMLTISNPPGTGPPSGLSDSGGGYGLQGIAERVLLVGGQVEAGRSGAGWRVEARVPA